MDKLLRWLNTVANIAIILVFVSEVWAHYRVKNLEKSLDRHEALGGHPQLSKELTEHSNKFGHDKLIEMLNKHIREKH